MSVNSNDQPPVAMPAYGVGATQINIHPLYAATLTQVSASGDLAEMKRLEAAAEQQLADHDDVAKALQDLKAEIAKLS
jgi:hypothetical protein